MGRKRKEPSITRDEMWRQTEKRAEKYKKLNSFEQFAMYMGVAQLLELSLKNLLSEKYNYDLDKLEKWTLGRTARELEKNGLRTDFIILLKSVVETRNYIAHELLANEIVYLSFLKDSIPENYYSKEERSLHKAIYQLEQLIVIFNWTQENEGWD